MKAWDPYVKVVEWSEEDGGFIPSSPEIFYRDCRRDDPRDALDELLQRVEESVEQYRQEGLHPAPHSSNESLNGLQKSA